MKFSKLKGRIKEKGYSESSFAKALGITANSLRMKLNGRTQFKMDEVSKSMSLLDIDASDICLFFLSDQLHNATSNT